MLIIIIIRLRTRVCVCVRWFQVAGVRFAFNPDRPPGARLIRDSVTVQDEPLIDEKLYRLCTKSYLASGKDGYDCLAGARVIVNDEDGPVLSTVVQNHFKSVNIMLGQQKSRYLHHQSIIPVNRRKSLASPLAPFGNDASNGRLLDEDEEKDAFPDVSIDEHFARLSTTPNSTRLHRRRTLGQLIAVKQRRESIHDTENSEIRSALMPLVENRIRISSE